jgi:AcrR family transcriptional regulator
MPRSDGQVKTKTRSAVLRRPLDGRRTRAEKTEQTQLALIEATAELVGMHGYAETSVAMITIRAKVAQGTFYNYFENRQEIFDLLPPRYAEKMLRYISEKIDSEVGLDREMQRFAAYFEFFRTTRESERIIFEAAAMTPKGYASFYRIVSEGYARALRRGIARGDVRAMDDEELKTMVNVLVALRNGLSHQLLLKSKRERVLSRSLLRIYRDFVSKVLFLPTQQ